MYNIHFSIRVESNRNLDYIERNRVGRIIEERRLRINVKRIIPSLRIGDKGGGHSLSTRICHALVSSTSDRNGSRASHFPPPTFFLHVINRLDNYFLSPLILPILSTLLFPRDCLFHDTGTYRRSEWRLSRSTSSLLRLRACVIVYPAWYVDLVFSFYHTILSSSRVKIRRLFVEGRVRGGGERRKKIVITFASAQCPPRAEKELCVCALSFSTFI